MPSLLHRRVAPVLTLGVVVALVLSSCSSTTSPAVSVNGTDISVETIEDELAIIKANPAYQEALEGTYGVSLLGEGKGTYDTRFVAQVLSLQIYYALIEQELDERGIEVDADDLRDARKAIDEQLTEMGKDGVLDEFPEAYRVRLARQQTLVETASDVGAEEYFAEHEDEFTEACVSHVLVSLDGRDEESAEARAQELKDRIDAGEDFAAVATAESDDGSAPSGGDLDCGPRGRFVEAFEAAVFDLPIGEVSEPVQTEFGFHLIVVRSREPASFDDVADQVRNQFFLEIVCDEDADVDVNPRYGTWDLSPCKDEVGLAQVKPPEKPTTTTEP